MLQELAKDWSSYNLTIYTDGSVKNGTETGGGGILATTGHPRDPIDLHSNAIPASTWCSNIQAEMKVIKKQIVQAEESPKKA